MADRKYISIINQGGLDLYLKDLEARELIAAIGETGVKWIGVTTTSLSDGATTAVVVIAGEDHTAARGDIVSIDEVEYIFNGTKWQRFGVAGTFKALAFKDSASGSTTLNDYMTGGSNAASSVTLSGGSTSKLVKTSIVPTDGTETVSKVTSTGSKLATVSITPTNGTESVSKVTKTAAKLDTISITPAGAAVTASKVNPTTKKLVTTSITPAGTAGTVHDTPTLNKSAIGSASDWSAGTVGTAGHNISYVEADERLTITAGTAGTAPSLTITSTQVGTSLTAGTEKSFATVGNAVTVATGASAANGEGAAFVDSVGASDVSAASVGTAVTVAAGTASANGSGADVVTAVTISDKTVAKAGSAVTVATGGVNAEGDGASVITSISITDRTVAKVGTAVDVATGAVDANGTGATVATALHTGGTADAQTFTPVKGDKTVSITVS